MRGNLFKIRPVRGVRPKLFDDFELYHQFHLTLFFSCLLHFGQVYLFGIFAMVVLALSTVAFRVISITRKDNAPAKKKRVHFAPMIVTVRTIYQSKQEVRDNRATYARVSILRYFSECQRIIPADAPFVPLRGKQGGPKLVVDPAAGEIKKRVHFLLRLVQSIESIRATMRCETNDLVMHMCQP